MDITALTDSLRQDLARAAEIGGDDTKAAAERLLLALDPALRLTLMDALCQAATDVSAAIPGVAVSVRLQGREPVFVVEGAPPAAARRGQSLNTWLVGAARAAASDRPQHSGESVHGFPGRRMKGWVK